MERRTDKDPMREDDAREHGRSDRNAPGREQRPQHEQFPGQKDRPGRMSGETERRPQEGERQPGRHEQPPRREEDNPRKFGERRNEPPAGRRNQSR